MSYDEIFFLGWSLNAFMFFINLFLAITILKASDPTQVYKEHQVLHELKEEFDKYYPNRAIETLISYFIPFVAFYRVAWRFFELKMFLNKNAEASMFDFMVYKYQADIQKAKN